MITSLTRTSTCLLPPSSLSTSWRGTTAATYQGGECSTSWTFTPASKKSNGLRPPASTFLHRKQWFLKHQTSGQYLQSIGGRELIWTEHPAMAHAWLSTEPIRAMLLTDPELFGDLSQLQAIEHTFVASTQAPHDWVFYA